MQYTCTHIYHGSFFTWARAAGAEAGRLPPLMRLSLFLCWHGAGRRHGEQVKSICDRVDFVIYWGVANRWSHMEWEGEAGFAIREGIPQRCCKLFVTVLSYLKAVSRRSEQILQSWSVSADASKRELVS